MIQLQNFNSASGVKCSRVWDKSPKWVGLLSHKNTPQSQNKDSVFDLEFKSSGKKIQEALEQVSQCQQADISWSQSPSLRTEIQCQNWNSVSELEFSPWMQDSAGFRTSLFCVHQQETISSQFKMISQSQNDTFHSQNLESSLRIEIVSGIIFNRVWCRKQKPAGDLSPLSLKMNCQSQNLD